MEITDQINEPVVFWLDAHFSSGITSEGTSETPILNELKLILERLFADEIFIDDAHLFNGTNGYPSFSELETMAEHNSSKRRLFLSSNIIHIYPNF